MHHTFTTELLGLKVEVECTLIPGEPQYDDCPAVAEELEDLVITHKGCEFEVDDLPDSALDKIYEDAFRTALEEAQEYHGD